LYFVKTQAHPKEGEGRREWGVEETSLMKSALWRQRLVYDGFAYRLKKMKREE
jgi:hypothetical protein